jgi:hypothetical protein
MPDLVRSIASRLRRFIGNRRGSPRFRIKLPLSISVVDATHTGSNRHAPTLDGYTRDLGLTGLGIIVPAIRIESEYLTHQNRKLMVKLQLPDGQVEIEASCVRYLMLEKADQDKGHLIGVKIASMSDNHRARYLAFVKNSR